MWVGFDAAKRLSIGLRSRQTPKLAVGFRFAAKPMTPAHSQPLPDDLFLLRVAEQAQLLPSCKTVLRDFHQSPPARLPQIENEPLTSTPLITIIHIVRPKTLIEGSFSYPLDSDRISKSPPRKNFFVSTPSETTIHSNFPYRGSCDCAIEGRKIAILLGKPMLRSYDGIRTTLFGCLCIRSTLVHKPSRGTHTRPTSACTHLYVT